IVGDPTLAAPAAKSLLEARWVAALGNPEIFCMAPADQTWRPLLATDPSQTYDSLVLAWDMLGTQGALSEASAQQLLNTSESYAQQVGRRAMSLPTPAEVPNVVRHLTELQESLDIGFALYVHPRSDGFAEADVWRACAALGLDLSPNGLFELRSPDWPTPLLGVGPVDTDQFTLSAAASGRSHSGLEVGFSVPLSSDPMKSLESCFLCAQHLAQRLRGAVFDDEDQPVSDRSRAQMRSALAQAVAALSRAGVPAGSVQALKLFRSG
ncbi:MAG TPA: cell division protein ZipA C-terminal FtsZ-binding domain-containing protein, partial [Fimbriimonadaceae bacterium]|nr:cell division protein ZipA C-terminal FtsZ-binding domain-containing protein [Fimbriimonadaceae bacterium]